MRLKLWHRLAIAFAALSIAALLAFAWLQQQSLQNGFLDYLNRLSLERLPRKSADLSPRERPGPTAPRLQWRDRVGFAPSFPGPAGVGCQAEYSMAE